jgi:hypothetical protein
VIIVADLDQVARIIMGGGALLVLAGVVRAISTLRQLTRAYNPRGRKVDDD